MLFQLTLLPVLLFLFLHLSTTVITVIRIVFLLRFTHSKRTLLLFLLFIIVVSKVIAVVIVDRNNK